jgi:hypothetical protein
VVGIHWQILDAEWKFKFLRKLQKDQRSGKRASALRMFGNFKEGKRVIAQRMAAGGEWRGGLMLVLFGTMITLCREV